MSPDGFNSCLIPLPLMTLSKNIGFFQRLRDKSRNFTTSKSRKPTSKKRRSHIITTPAEKATAAAKRRAERENLKADLQKIRQLIMDRAAELSHKYPGHNTEYYFEQILQLGRINHGKREKVSLWNAFLALETKEMKGSFIVFYGGFSTSLFFRIVYRGGLSQDCRNQSQSCFPMEQDEL